MTTITEILEIGLSQLREAIITRSRNEGQEASGETYSKIRVQVDGYHGEIWAPVYLYTLSIGRGPGKVPLDFPAILEKWATYKGITFPNRSDLMRWANAVAWKIRREGTQLYRRHGEIDIFQTPIREFEQWLEKQLDVFYTSAIDEALIPEYRR